MSPEATSILYLLTELIPRIITATLFVAITLGISVRFFRKPL